MSKKILSLFLALSLVLGLVVPGVKPQAEALAEEYTLKVGGVSYTLAEYDTPVYSQNATKTGYFNTVTDGEVTDSVQKEYTTQELGGGENDYNVKLVWHAGDNGPTLYLKGAVVDNYNEDLSLWRYASATSESAVATSAIYTGNTAPLKIVIESDSSIQTWRGIHYREELEIKSQGEAKLDLWTRASGIMPTTAETVNITDNNMVSGKKLTLDANLNITLNAYVNSQNSGYIVRAIGADMIINGGSISAKYVNATKKNVTSFGVTSSGNLYVNGGYVYGEAINTTGNYTSAAFRVTAGNVYISGGTLEAYAASHSGIRAVNIYMTGGTVKTDTKFAAMLTNSSAGEISITGGTVEATVRGGSSSETFAYYNSSNQYLERPALGAEAEVYAGTTAENAAKVSDPDSYGYIKKYIKVTYPAPQPTDPSATTAPTEQTTAPTEQTTAPTEQTTAPTEQTTAPTQETTAPTEQTTAPTEQTTAPTEQTTAPTEPTNAPGAAIYTLKIDGVTYTLTGYDAAVYSRNTTKTGFFNTVEEEAVTDSKEKEYTTQVIGGSVTDYNVKLVWAAGEAGPTLYLKGAIVDNYNEELGLWRYSSATEKTPVGNAGIYTDDAAPLKIVIEADSSLKTYRGIHYREALEIKSEGEAKLDLWTYGTGIVPTTVEAANVATSNYVKGKKLTLNANLNVTLNVWVNEVNSSYIIRTVEADMVIDGGNIVTAYNSSTKKNLTSFGVVTSGNLYVNGGYVYGIGVHTSANYTNAAFRSDGNVYITGGTVEAYAYRHSGIRAQNIYVTGGTVKTDTYFAGMFTIASTGEISITGGTVECTTRGSGAKTFGYYYNSGSTKTQYVNRPVLGADAEVYAGNDAASAAKVSDAEDFGFNKKYTKVVYGGAPVDPSDTTPTSGTTPSETTAPTSGTTPSQTTAPSGQAIYTLKIDGVTYTLTEYDVAVYSRNTAKTGCFNTVEESAVTDSKEKEYTAQVIGGSETDYNVKLIWATGEAGPTLYLKGAIVDNYNEELGLWRYSSATSKNPVANTGIYTGSAAPLKIVIESDSTIQVRKGIHYQNDLEIKSVGEAKLDLWTYGTGIVPTSTDGDNVKSSNYVKGKKLTLDANLAVTLNGWPDEANAGYIIRTMEADMVINGGNIVTGYNGPSKKTVRAFGVVTSGNLYINGGYVYGASYNSSSYTDAAFRVAGDVYITGGTVEAYAKSQSGIRGANIYISGGKVTTDTYFGGLLASTSEGVISITGGEVVCSARANNGNGFAYYYKNSSNAHAQAAKVPTIGSGLYVYAGASAEAAELIEDVTAYNFKAKFVQVSASSVAPTAGTTTPTGSTEPTGLTSYTVKMDNISYTITDYDQAVYSVNGTKSGYFHTVADGAVVATAIKDYASQDKTGANESNYNVKLIWHTGDNGPTLYLRNAIIDTYDDELGKWRYKYENAKDIADYAAIVAPATAPLKIVIEGGESKLHVYEGIHFANDLTIESVGDAKLDLWTYRTGIIPTKTGSGYVNSHVSGAKLTLNANLNVSMGFWANASNGGYVVRTVGADLTINGGNIVIDYRGAAKDCRGIGVEDSGNLYVNGGYLYSKSYNTANQSDAAIRVAGDVYISGGTVEAYSKSQSGIRAKNIYITGGTVKTDTNYAGMFVTSETGVISISNADLVEVTVRASSGGVPFAYMYKNDSDKYAQSVKVPTVASGLYVAAGDHRYNYVTVEDLAKYEYKDKYIRISVDVPPPTEATEPPPSTEATEATAPSLTNPTVDPTAASGAVVPEVYTMKVAGISLTVSKYEEAVYTMNKEAEGLDMKGNKYTKIIQTKEGANEENWNAKLIWHVGDYAPTLYLRGFVVDEYNNDSGLEPENENDLMEATYKEADQTYTRKTTAAIVTSKNWPLHIVLTGEDSKVEAHFGITFYHNTTITSEGDTKLVMNNYASCIAPNKSYGALTINANLDLKLRKFYNGEYAEAVIHTYGGTLTVNGGNLNLKCSTAESKRLVAMYAKYHGDLVINGGNITAMSIVGRSRENGCLRAGGTLTINGGTLKVTPKLAVCLYATKGIVMNGGDVTLMATWNAVNMASGAPFTFNGGNLTIMSQYCFDSTSRKNIKLGEGTYAYAGINAKDCQVFDGTNTKLGGQPWMFFTSDPSKQIEIEEEEEEDIPLITLPTQATEATDATGAPGVNETPEATGAPDATVAPEATDAPQVVEPTFEGEIPDVEIPGTDTKIKLIPGTIPEISQELIDAGFDTVEKIREYMLQSLWALDETIDYIALFDAVLMYQEGDEWVKADETHFPEEGFLKVLLPYPKGTDSNTQFTAVHMFSSSAFGKTPGEIELVYVENTAEGIEVYVTGLSPIMLGWTVGEAPEADLPETDIANPTTGDAGVTMFAALMLVAVLGMGAVLVIGKKREI